MLELEVASLAAIFALGLRHGIDPDHLAAIGDLVGSQIRARRAIFLATAYALGHAATVFVLSATAALAGSSIPEGMVSVMDEVVGASLVLMGIYLLYTLARWGSRARLQSRWSLLATALGRLRRRRSGSFLEIEHDHRHEADPSHGHVHSHNDDQSTAPARAPVVTTAAHGHRHRHVLPLPKDPLPARGVAASLGIGVLHGIGAETPSQILLLAAAAGRGYSAILLAGTFVAGLLVSNTLVAVAGALGLGWLRQGSRLYVAGVLLASIFSLVVGARYLVS